MKCMKRKRDRNGKPLPKLRIISAANPNLASVSSVEPDSTESPYANENSLHFPGEIRTQRIRKQVEPFNITIEEKRKKNVKPKTIQIKTELKSKLSNTILKHFTLINDSDASEQSSRPMSAYSDDYMNDNCSNEDATLSNTKRMPFLGKEISLHPINSAKKQKTNAEKNILHLCKYCDQIYFNTKSLAIHQLEHIQLSIKKINSTRILSQSNRRVKQIIFCVILHGQHFIYKYFIYILGSTS